MKKFTKLFISVTAVMAVTMSSISLVYAKGVVNDTNTNIPAIINVTDFIYRIPFIGPDNTILFAVHFPDEGRLVSYNAEGFQECLNIEIADESYIQAKLSEFSSANGTNARALDNRQHRVPFVSSNDTRFYSVFDPIAGRLTHYDEHGEATGGWREMSSLDELVELLTINIEVHRPQPEMSREEFIRLNYANIGETFDVISREAVGYNQYGEEVRRPLTDEENWSVERSLTQKREALPISQLIHWWHSRRSVVPRTNQPNVR